MLIPKTPSTQSRVRLSDASDGSVNDISNSPFTIGPLPGMPVLLQPINNALIGVDSVRFVWAASQPDVVLYWFEVADDSLFTVCEVDSAISDTSKMMRQLPNKHTYSW